MIRRALIAALVSSAAVAEPLDDRDAAVIPVRLDEPTVRKAGWH